MLNYKRVHIYPPKQNEFYFCNKIRNVDNFALQEQRVRTKLLSKTSNNTWPELLSFRLGSEGCFPVTAVVQMKRGHPFVSFQKSTNIVFYRPEADTHNSCKVTSIVPL